MKNILDSWLIESIDVELTGIEEGYIISLYSYLGLSLLIHVSLPY
jgi:hypothetical protein